MPVVRITPANPESVKSETSTVSSRDAGRTTALIAPYDPQPLAAARKHYDHTDPG
jgi:hypothetical protein